MQLSYYQQLLDHVKSVNSKYESIAAISGANFNVFRILKMEASEVKLHSMFLAELLNPNGSHGQKGKFLEIFTQKFLKKNQPFQAMDARVKVEKYAGKVDIEEATGGRLDICITDCKQEQIIIENKIYARDGFQQLQRYHNQNPQATIFYLTLEGTMPHESSSVNLQAGNDYMLLSYRTDIINWLYECREKSVTNPSLRESITQYINLIKYLTGQSVNDNMNEELNNLLIQNKENLNSAFLIANALDSALEKLVVKLKSDVEQIAEEIGFEYYFYLDFEQRYTGFAFYPSGWERLCVNFQFWNYDKKFVFGISRPDINDDLPLKYAETVKQCLNLNKLPSNEWWLYFEDVELYPDWNLVEPWLAVLNGDMKIFIKNRVEELVKKFEGHML